MSQPVVHTGPGLATLLFLLFLGLKLAGVIAWPWIFVFLPLIVAAGLWVIVFLVVLVALVATSSGK